MKVVSAKQMAEIEGRAYKQGSSEHDFMENAGLGVAVATHDFITRNKIAPIVWLLCGKGNNAGDAFVAGRYLLEQGYTVKAIQFESLDQCSPLCQQNGKLFLERKGELTNKITDFGSEGLLLDGIFGTGFKGKVEDPYASLIQKANTSGLPILAIDIPSGLNGTTGEIEGVVIQATETIFLGLPKIGFFLENAWNVVGKLRYVNFGLPQSLIDDAPAEFHLMTKDLVSQLLPSIQRNRHKYQAGYVIGLASSLTMPGAGLLSCLAAFRTGSGMVRLLYPSGMEAELSASPYELIKIPYTYENPETVKELMQKASATFVGPGLGRSESTKQLLQETIPFLEKPCVIDADALTFYAEGAFDLPPHPLLTPHTGEMQKLLNSAKISHPSLDLLHTCQKYAEDRQTTLILKGAPTFIFHPNSPIYVNPTGDPGMATAGSGDVLTGILASLLSQGLDCHQGALLGVYLHGLSGEFAAQNRGSSYGIIASDLIDHLGSAFADIA